MRGVCLRRVKIVSVLCDSLCDAVFVCALCDAVFFVRCMTESKCVV
jgi:hypothetical protein